MNQDVGTGLQPTFALKPHDTEVQSGLHEKASVHSTIELLDSLMQARENLFNEQLKQGLKPHLELNKVVLK